MHDCALERDGIPSAPRVEHRYYAADGINRKIGGVKIKGQKDHRLLYFLLIFF